MTSDRLRRLDEIFQAALAVEASERERYVRERCAGDVAMAEEILDLLRHDQEASTGFLASPQLHADEATTRLKRHRGMPERIGPYRVLAIIGTGGMGTVYLARQESPIVRQVALKTIRESSPSREILARFEAERQALALMEHPNVARIYDAGTTDEGLAYFAMEYVDGVPISEYVRDADPSLADRIQIFLQACAAVQHAHQKGIIHRDLKPGNILVTASHGAVAVKVIDFGIAKAVGGELGSTSVTMAGEVLGTPEYMSPEQAGRSRQDVDTRTDIYALGVVLYELLTSVLPHERRDLRLAGIEEMLRIIREEDPPLPSARLKSLGSAKPGTPTPVRRSPTSDPLTLSRRVAGDLDWIVMKALEKNRDRRYSSVSELAEDLRRHLRDEPVQAGPPSRSYRLRKFVRRHRRGLVAASLAGLGLLAGAGAAVWQWGDARASRLVAEQRERDREWTGYVATLAIADAAVGASDLRTARLTLDGAPEHLRGWEWRHERARLDSGEEVLHRHDTALSTLAASTDGRWIVAGDYHGHLRALSSDAKKAVAHDRHDKGIQALAFVPGRPLVAVAVFDGSFGLLDLEKGAWAWHFDEGEAYARSLAFDPLGEVLLAATSDGTLVLRDARDGSRRSAFDGRQARIATFTTDGRHVVGATTTGMLEVWRRSRGDVGPPQLERSLTLGNVRPWFMARSPDGRLFVTTSAGEVVVIDTRAWRVVDRLEGPGQAGALGVWADGRVAVSSTDRVVRVWDTVSRRVLAEGRGHESYLTGVACLPDGSFVTCSEDGTIRRWPRRLSSARHVVRAHRMRVAGVGFDPTGRAVISASEEHLRVWDASDGHLVREIAIEGDRVESMKASRDGSLVAVGTSSGRLLRWDPVTWLQHAPIVLGPNALTVVDVSGDGAIVAAGTHAGDVTVLEAKTGTEHLRLEDLPGFLFALALSDDGRLLALGWLDGTLQVRDARSGALLEAREGAGIHVRKLAFSPDGRWLVAALGDGSMWAHDVAGDAVLELDGHVDAVEGLAFMPDGSRLASTSMDRTTRLWTLDRAEPIVTMRAQASTAGCVGFSPDGTRMASAAEDGSLVVWDSISPRERGAPAGR